MLKDKYGKIEEYHLYKELLQFAPSEDEDGQKPEAVVKPNPNPTPQ